MHTTAFTKRIYTPSTFNTSVCDIVDHMSDLRAARLQGGISRAFAEKIMMAVTRVNGCRYCSYVHTRAALSAGVLEAELQALMAGDFGDLPEHELVALVFAQHYAESKGNPDPAAWQRLVDYYGAGAANEIMAYLRMITFGNLYGNTFDALLSRLAGKPAPGSSFWSEMGVLLGGVVLVPARMIGRLLRR